jgi:hypothetical protein
MGPRPRLDEAEASTSLGFKFFRGSWSEVDREDDSSSTDS